MYRILKFVVICGGIPAIILVLAADFSSSQKLFTGYELYKVIIESDADADALARCGVDALLKIKDGYLVLADDNAEMLLKMSSLRHEYIASDISRENLAINFESDIFDANNFPLIYRDDRIRLYLIDNIQSVYTDGYSRLQPILGKNLPIVFNNISKTNFRNASPNLNLDSLVNLVSTDSLISYMDSLESYGIKRIGTSGNYASRDWLAQKLNEFGYDSVIIDSFKAIISMGVYTDCMNVITRKEGTEYPEFNIIIGAHRDTEVLTPGADDNASGTSAVLELARIFKDIETRFTLVFILFDSEEYFLTGSWHYANNAALRGDKIIFMHNIDMIGHEGNDHDARIPHSQDMTYAMLWRNLADSLDYIDIIGHLAGTDVRGDSYPFEQHGYSIVWADEYIRSTHYHQLSDSTTYINFDYMTRMTKACLATVLTTDDTYMPPPQLSITFPDEPPLFLSPQMPDSFSIAITGEYGGIPKPEGGFLNYAVNGGQFIPIQMNSPGDGLYEAVLPPLPCGSELKYYISIEENDGELFTYPEPDFPRKAFVAAYDSLIFEDDFETDKGWIVTGTAFEGHWERCIPIAGEYYMAPTTDYDGSGMCYVTDDTPLSGVGWGTTVLESPVNNLTGEEYIVMDYYMWFHDGPLLSGKNDTFRVYLSPDNGADWVLAEQIASPTRSVGGWFNYPLLINDFVDSLDLLKIRFEASDLHIPSFVEAAIDAVKIHDCSCEGSSPYIANIPLPDWTEGVAYYQWLVGGGDGEIVWTDKYNDLYSTGLTLSSEGLLSGIPISAGDILFVAMITDEMMNVYEQEFSFTVNQTPTVTTESLPDAFVTEFYSFQIEAEGGTGTLEYSDRFGDLSGTGLTLSLDGLLSGTPVDTGTIEFHVKVKDSLWVVGDRLLSLHVDIPYICGDANGDEIVNILDITYVISFLYKGGPDPDPYEAADVNDDIIVNLLDITYLINHLYKGGPEPVCLW